MKKQFILIVIFIFFTNFIRAQVNVGTMGENVTFKPGKIDKSDLEILKTTKTIFVYQEADKPYLEEMKNQFLKVWTITPLEFISWDKIMEYKDYSKYSFLTINAVVDGEHNRLGIHGGFNEYGVFQEDFSGKSTKFYLYLYQYPTNKKGDIKGKNIFCRIELNPTEKSAADIMNRDKDISADFKINVFELFYTQCVFKNWNTGFLKTYLKIVNDCLNDNKLFSYLKGETNVSELSKLKFDTLFVPDYCIAVNKSDTVDKQHKTSLREIDLFKDYAFPYKILPTKEISDRILSGTVTYYMVSLAFR